MFSIDSIGAPIIIIAFLVEYVIALRSGMNEDLPKDMLANFALGLGVLVTGLLMKGVAFALYSTIYSKALFQPALSAGLWVAGLLSCDLVLYWYHRLGHQTRLFWAAHVTHHSSLHFNLSVGLRVNCIHSFYRFLFWSPLCWLGIPPWMILFFESATAMWNVFIHTERVGKLGPLDWIFNTLSNHRVHHASNPEYIDKNLGGILIIYDHLFGTYVPETGKVDYGITKNIHTHDPREILLHEYKALFRELKQVKGWRDKLSYLFSPPGTSPKPETAGATIGQEVMEAV
ncbi:sterol desaturase family protein [Flavihumibacter rivuli]|uniref:sterol desaturase family protein n=1 Tax=Flavihumibacter rivuli TaxID=2838156 RepID=UPI001BDF2FA4|nr:sterol desaturase family protein [Flavihumibacter rivuli]ULQ55958.1 sterol desaturase family protein [Flavihumibacter rivuli]